MIQIIIGTLVIATLGVAVYVVSTKKTHSIQSKEISDSQPHEGEGKPRTSIIQFDHKDTTIYHTFQKALKSYGDRPCYGNRPVIKIHKEEKIINDQKKVFDFAELGPYKKFSYKDIQKRIDSVSSGLRQVGLEPKGILGIYADTCLEWSLAAHSCFSQSITVATIYTSLGEEAVEFGVKDTSLSYMLTSGRLLQTVANATENIKSLRCVIYIDKPNAKGLEALAARGVEVISFEELEKKGSNKNVDAVPPNPNDTAMIMYTSGSTGNPKGVLLSHKGVCAAASSTLIGTQYKVSEKDVYISYLPLAHVLAFVAELSMLENGVFTGFGTPRTLSDASVRNCRGDLKELRPTLMAGVPSVYERLKKGVLSKVNKSPLQKYAFKIAFNIKSALLSRGFDLSILNKLIFHKISAEAGGNLNVMLSGGAPISSETLNFLRVCFCCDAVQGYGLTETSGACTVMSVNDKSYGNVGAPLPGSIIKLVDVPEMKYFSTDKPPRGEIWVSGMNLCDGYYKNKELTDKDFNGKWFKTGDVGEWTENGTLRIFDRIKNLVKLAHGEYIALESVESKLKKSEYVENLCLYGDSEKDYLVALVCPHKEALESWAKKNNAPTKWEELCKDPKATKEVLDSLVSAGKNSHLSSVELPKKVFICSEEWTPENDLLAPSMKLKRASINKAFKKEIEKLYEDDNSD